MRPRPVLRGLLALALAIPLSGCVGSDDDRRTTASPRSVTATAVAPDRPPATDAAPPALPPPLDRREPAKNLAIGVRHLDFSRGADRPLPTTVWYPAASGTVGGAPGSDVAVAAGRFPLVLLSHGLTGLPEYLAPIATRWAAAGFIVAGPAYPHTKHSAPQFDISDVANQPLDASSVISQVLALDGKAGDPFAGHLDKTDVAAAGHSAGGYTTTGMLSSRRDPRLRAAIVIAGALLGGAYNGPATPVLFVHGDADPTVQYSSGRAAYAAVPWQKAFLTLVGGDHSGYLAADGAGFDQVIRTTTDFLRWALYGDGAARGRLAGDGTAAGTSRWESRL